MIQYTDDRGREPLILDHQRRLMPKKEESFLKRQVKKYFALLLTGSMLLLAGCGAEGGRNVNATNAVDNAIKGQIAAEEQKTAAATEAVPEPVTEEPKTTEPQTSEPKTSDTQAATEQGTTEEVTEKKAERTAEDDKKMLDEIHASYQGEADRSVDIDLTAMDSDMVYATVYQMIYADPEAYVGKTFKAAGTLTVATSSVTNLYYPYVIIKDALACCQQGVEFQWGEKEHTSAEDFPEEGSEIEVIGTFETYREEGDPYLYTRLADTDIKVISEPEKHKIEFTYE